MKIGQTGADESAKAPTWARGIMDQSWFYDKAGSTPGTIESEMNDDGGGISKEWRQS